MRQDDLQTCPKCRAPIEGRTIGWSVWQCGRTTDDPTGDGYNACDYAASLRAEVERMRPVVEAAMQVGGITDLGAFMRNLTSAVDAYRASQKEEPK